MEFLCLRIPPGPLLVSTGGWILAGSPSSSSPDLTCMLISRSVTGNMMIVLDFTKCYWATDLLGVAVLLLLLKLLLILLSKKRMYGDVVKLHHVIVVLNRRFAMFVSLLLCQIFYAYIYWLVFAGAASSRKNWGPTHNYLPLQAPLTVLVFGKIQSI